MDTLLLPADVSWSEGAEPAPRVSPAAPTTVGDDAVESIATALRSGEPSALLIGGTACRGRALVAGSRVASTTGTRLLCETLPARLERGAGVPPVERIAYLAEFAVTQLDGLRHLVIVDAKEPVSFFAYPGKASYLVPDGCEVHVLAGPGDDAPGALESLAAAVGAELERVTVQNPCRPDAPTGTLTAETVGAALGALLPEGVIVSDEGLTSGLYVAGLTAGAPPHDWLCLTGGAIGQGLPVALGAAVASPGRRVIALEADGSALYTFQSLWTMAREGLDVTMVLLNNGSYAVLNMELDRVGAEAGGPRAKEMLDLTKPDIDFVALAAGLGVPATKATTADEFSVQLRKALATGPSLVEAVLPPIT